jgi:hypothetical protein
MAHPADQNKEEGSDIDPGAYHTPVAVPGSVPAAWEEEDGMEEGRLMPRARVQVGGMALPACMEEAEAKNHSWVQVLVDSRRRDPWEDEHTVHWGDEQWRRS